MRKEIMEMVFIGMVLLALIGLLFSSAGGISGNVVRVTPDYQKYKAKLTSDALDVLAKSYTHQKNEFIVTLADYDSGLEDIYDVVSKSDVKELPLVDAVSIESRKAELIEILESKDITGVSLNGKVELLRDSALETLNISNMRLIGPAAMNMTGSGVKIAVIDTGIDYTHPEFNCTPGADGCSVRRYVSLFVNQFGDVVRNRLLTSFSDSSTSKLLDLSSGEQQVSILLPEDAVINSAILDVSPISNVDEVFALSQVAPKSVARLDLRTALESATCTATVDDYCLYNITLTGNGTITLENLEVNYSFTRYERIGYEIDDDGHGTMVSGILHRTAPDVELYVYKAMRQQFGQVGGSIADQITAMEMAIADDVDIITMSLGASRGGDACSDPYPAFEAAVDLARSHGIIVAVAAGNDPSEDVYIPACYENSLAIGAIRDNKALWEYSTPGPELDYAMPGVDITSTSLSGSYATGSGTSFAAPFATSILSLFMEKFSESTQRKALTFQTLRAAQNSALDIATSGFDEGTGYGMLQPNRIISTVVETPVWAHVPTLALSSSIRAVGLELYGEGSVATLTWNNLTVGSGNVPITINNQGSPFTVNISGSVPLLVEVDTSSIDLLAQQIVYTANITVASGEKSLIVPLQFNYTTNYDINEINRTMQYGLFSYDQVYYALLEYDSLLSQIGSHDQVDYFASFDTYAVNGSLPSIIGEFNLSEETRNYLLFWVDEEELLDDFNYQLVQPSSLNLGYYIIPLLISHASDDLEFSITITGPDGEEELECVMGDTSLSSLSSISGGDFDKICAFTTSGEFYANVDSDFAIVQPLTKPLVFFEEPLYTNLFPFTKTGTYVVDLYVKINDVPFKLRSNTITVYDNLSILLKDGFLFLNELQTIEFDVKDNVKTLNRVSGLNYYDAGLLYATPTIALYLDGVLLAANITPDNVTVNLTGVVEGLHYLDIIYSYYDSTATSHDLVTVLNALQVDVGQDNLNLSNQNNLTLAINLSKAGNLTPSVNVSLSVDSICDDFIGMNDSSFALTNLSSVVSTSILIYLTSDTQYSGNCTLDITAEVSEVCEHCENESTSFTEIHEHSFRVVGKEPNVSLSLLVSDSDIRLGEYFAVYANVTNHDNYSLSATLNVENNATLIPKSATTASLSLSANTTGSASLEFYSKDAGSYEPVLKLSNSAFSKNASYNVTVAGELFSYSITKNDSSIYQSEEFDLTLKVTNNNNAGFTPSITVSAGDFEISEEPIVTSISATSSKEFVYTLQPEKSGTLYFGGIIKKDMFNTTFNYSISINSGQVIPIVLTDSYEKYRVGINDTVVFETDIGCEDTYESCNDTCADLFDTCDDSCKADFEVFRSDRDICRQNCDAYDDSDERKDCRDECNDAYEEGQSEKDECAEECGSDENECTDECSDTHEECTDEIVEASILVVMEDEFEEDRLEFEVEGEDETGFTLALGDSKKLDVDDDGYYETEMLLYELVEDENYTCKDDCEAVFDADKAECSSEYDSCRNDCDDSDCRDECKDDEDYCKDDATDDYNDCIDDCDIQYSHYELKIKSVALEETSSSTEVCTNVTLCHSESGCTNAGGYWYNSVCNLEPQANCTSTTVVYCTEELCSPTGGFWYEGSCHTEEQVQCSSENRNLCVDETGCTAAGGYWYNQVCNIEQLLCGLDSIEGCVDVDSCLNIGGYWYDSTCHSSPEESCNTNIDLCDTEESCLSLGYYWYDFSCHNEPALECSLEHIGHCTTQESCEAEGGIWDNGCVTLEAEEPSVEKPSGKGRYLIIAAIVLLIGGVAGTLVMLRRSPVIEPDKRQKLIDYIMKQVERGNDFTYVIKSLKNLGWDEKLIEDAAAALHSDPRLQQITKIARFALQNKVNDPSLIRQHFRSVDPSVMEEAMEEISKRKHEMNDK